jgi:hypothetical protein
LVLTLPASGGSQVENSVWIATSKFGSAIFRLVGKRRAAGGRKPFGIGTVATRLFIYFFSFGYLCC